MKTYIQKYMKLFVKLLEQNKDKMKSINSLLYKEIAVLVGMAIKLIPVGTRPNHNPIH
jgi:hypothetical protein